MTTRVFTRYTERCERVGNIERINNDIWNLVNEMRVHGAIVIWGRVLL